MPPRRHSLTCACVALAAAIGWIWMSEEDPKALNAGRNGPEAGSASSAAATRGTAMDFPDRVLARTPTRQPAGRVLAMPLAEDFTHRILALDRSAVSIPLPGGGKVDGAVTKLEMEDGIPLLVEGAITHPEPGRFHFRRQKLPGKAGALFGFIHFDESPLAWQVRPTGENGAPELVRVTVDEVLCRSFASPPAEIPAAHPVDDPVPDDENGIIQLQSLPGAEAVVYLDFDGETRDFEVWGFIDAEPSGASNSQIFEVWQGVCEDFQPFGINITTSRRVYEAAPPNQRMQVVVSPTDDASPGAGGVAIIGSFNSDGEVVCWAFFTTGKNAVEIISHEIGHTLGLSHDGRVSPIEEYYAGHDVAGQYGWAPIMGVGYGQPLTQWSKGEYPGANNFQDDLLIISGNNNGVAYRADDHGSTFANAGWLNINSDGDAFAEGIIEARSDRDSFRFSTFGGNLLLAFNPVPPIAGGTVPMANLDIKAELLQVTSSLTSIIATSDPGNSLAAQFNIPGLAPGDYLVRVSGTGRSNLVSGYSDYASLGSYTVTGNVAGGVHAERFVLAENSATSTVVGSVVPRADHSSGVLNFEITQDGSGGAFAIDPATGEITVVDGALLDFEALSSRWDDPATLDFIVTISDSLEYALETIRVVVTLSDLNEAPVFESVAPLSIPENVASGTRVTQLRANDPDRGDFVSYSIVSGNQGGVFAIDPGNGEITVAGSPDFQSVPVHNLVIRATDQADPANETDVALDIALLPVTGGVVAGFVTRTFYNDIAGSNLASLTNAPRFPEEPDSQVLLASFDTGTGTGFEYGSVVSGYVIAPAAGSYTFWISAGQSGELRLSPDMDRENAVPIAAVSGTSAPGEWNKEPSQQSAPVELAAGGVYYIEARHKQAWGTDHVQVAWQGPGMAQREIIPGLWLAPDDRQFAPWAADTSFAVRDGAAPGTVVGALPFLEPNLGQQVAGYAITGGNNDGNFTIDPADGTIRVAEGASFTPGDVYPLTVTATDDGDPAADGAATASVTVRRLDEGLFAWWQLDESTGDIARDSSGNQRDAPLAGSAAWVPRAAADQALLLDGIDAGFSHYDMDSPEALTPVTVAAWVKVPPEHAAEAIIFQQAGDPGPGYQRVSVTAAGNVRYVVYGPDADASGEGFQFDLVSTATIHDGQWHHVACVRDSADGRVFINGVESAAGTGTPRMLEAFSTFSVGYDAVSDTGHLDATVDDVRIYREALAASQIARIAAAPKIAFTEPAADGEIILPIGAGLMLGTEASSPGGSPPAISWSLASGPGAVVFDDPSAAATGVTFSATGTYLLRATAISGNDDIRRDIAVTYGCTAITPFAGGMIGTEGWGFHNQNGPGAYQILGDSPGILDGGTSDGFYLLGQVFAGNFDVRVRVDDALDDEIGEPLGIAGLVVREGGAGATDDASGFIGLRPASVVGTWIQRPTAGAANVVTDYPGISTPYWCRITRVGDLVEFWHSPDGNSWTSRGTMNIAGDVNVGMCWSSNAPEYPGTAYFSGLSGFSTGNLGAGVDAGPDFAAETTLAAQLSGTVTDDGLPDPPAATTTLWQPRSGPGAVDIADPADPLSAVTFGAAGEYVLRLLADDGAMTTFNDVVATVTDPLPVLAVEATTPDAAEEGPVNGVFTITRDVWLAGDLTVGFTLGGNADNILDYDELPTSVIIPDGVASVEVIIAPIADGLVEGPETVTLTLDPGDYLISDGDAQIAIADSNHAPEWASPVFPGDDATQDAPYSGTLAGTASDPDLDDTLVFTKESGPAWLEIASDGTLSGTPGNDDVGTGDFTVRVTDEGELFAEATLQITVLNVNDAPTFTADPVLLAEATQDTPYSETLAGAASDPDLGDTLVFTKQSGPAWLEVASDGMLSGIPGNDDVGSNEFIVRVTDEGELFGEATLQITVLNLNDAPTFTADPVVLAEATEDVPYSETLAGTASDPDLDDTLVFTKQSGPAWLQVASDGTISGTPGNSDIGPNEFIVRVTDAGELFAEATLQITVGINEAPVFASDPVMAGDATADVSYSDTLAGAASDPDPGDTLVFTKESGPVWLQVASDGTLSGTPGNSDIGPNGFTIRVTDAGGLFAEATLQIQVVFANQSPSFEAEIPAPPAAVAQIPYVGFAIADFADDPNLPQGDAIVFSKTSGPAWLEVASDGTLSGTPGISDIGPNEIVVRVADLANEFDETTLQIPVGPTILYLDLNGETTGSGAAGAVTWDDAAIWSAEADGVTATHAWVPGATAVLAAGNDSGNTSITLDGIQSLGTLIVEEGAHTLTGGSLALAEIDAVFEIIADTVVESPVSGTNLGKTGTGTLTIAGSGHALAGELALIDGRLEIDGSLLASGGVTVAAGATLAGDGTVDGGVSINGTLSPGADLGTLATGPLAMNDGSTLAWRIDSWNGVAGTDHDLVSADSLDLSGTLTVTVDTAAMADFTDTAAEFTLVSTTGGITGFGSADFVIDADSLPQATGHWEIVENGNDLALSYTPLTPFEQWQLAQFVEKSTDPLVSGELADPDADNLPNLIEYALGTDPELPGPGTVTHDFVEIEGTDRLRLTIPRNADATDIVFAVESTSDLSNPGSWTTIDTVIETDEPALLIVRDALGGPRRFMRLRVTR